MLHKIIEGGKGMAVELQLRAGQRWRGTDTDITGKEEGVPGARGWVDMGGFGWVRRGDESRQPQISRTYGHGWGGATQSGQKGWV